MPFLIAVFLFFITMPVYAQLSVTETQSMQFGDFVIRDLNQVALITASPITRTTSGNSNTILLTFGQPADYSVTGGPASTAYTVTIDADTDVTFNGLGGPPIITLDTFVVRPITLQTDGAGNDTFSLGATITTPGDGSFFNDGPYSGTYDFTVAF